MNSYYLDPILCRSILCALGIDTDNIIKETYVHNNMDNEEEENTGYTWICQIKESNITTIRVIGYDHIPRCNPKSKTKEVIIETNQLSSSDIKTIEKIYSRQIKIKINENNNMTIKMNLKI